MKGIILAGGLGTRLYPLTRNDNKHLLPVFDRRMVELPMRTLIDAGIEDIILITGGLNPGKFLEVFKNGSSVGAKRIYYTYQEGQGGIPAALKMAKPFVGNDESCVVILGDNYFEDGIRTQLQSWDQTGCSVFLKETNTPEQFGIATLRNKKIYDIKEKPSQPDSNLAVLGCYMFDSTVWSRLETLSISGRLELEIAGLLRTYISDGAIDHFSYDGFWKDMGTFENWMKVSERLSSMVNKV